MRLNHPEPSPLSAFATRASSRLARRSFSFSMALMAIALIFGAVGSSGAFLGSGPTSSSSSSPRFNAATAFFASLREGIVSSSSWKTMSAALQVGGGAAAGGAITSSPFGLYFRVARSQTYIVPSSSSNSSSSGVPSPVSSSSTAAVSTAAISAWNAASSSSADMVTPAPRTMGESGLH